MKILFVAPYPLSRVRVRSYGIVSQLAKHHYVKVLALCSGEQEAADARALAHEGFDITAVIEKRATKALRVFRSWRTQLPRQVAYDASPRLRAAIAAQLEAESFDLLHVEFIRALGALPDGLALPIVWDAVDCISQLYEQGAYYGATPMLRLLGRGEAQRTRSYELSKLYQFREILITSERDRQALLDLVQSGAPGIAEQPCAEITVLPNGIDRLYFQPYTGPRQPTTLVFSGKMSFHANIAGILTFCQHILPLIWHHRPDVRLVIAGANPPATIRRLTRDPRITVTGYVPDIRPYIGQAYIAVSPLPYAVGIQNKVLEAMALGTPVVASSCAAAGLQTTTGRDLLVADGADAFATAVLRLLDDPILWRELSQNGLRYVAANHDWASLTSRLTTVYDRAINTTQRTDAHARRIAGRALDKETEHYTQRVAPNLPPL